MLLITETREVVRVVMKHVEWDFTTGFFEWNVTARSMDLSL